MEHGSTVASITPQQHAIGTGSQVIDLKSSGAFDYIDLVAAVASFFTTMPALNPALSTDC
jgi:hypothetical protein